MTSQESTVTTEREKTKMCCWGQRSDISAVTCQLIGRTIIHFSFIYQYNSSPFWSKSTKHLKETFLIWWEFKLASFFNPQIIVSVMSEPACTTCDVTLRPAPHSVAGFFRFHQDGAMASERSRWFSTRSTERCVNRSRLFPNRTTSWATGHSGVLTCSRTFRQASLISWSVWTSSPTFSFTFSAAFSKNWNNKQS